MKSARFAIIFFIVTALACGRAVKKETGPDSGEKDAYSSYRAYDHFVKGDLYEQSGNLDGAVDEYRKALIYDPFSAEIRRTLSDVYFNQRKFSEAAVLRSEIKQKTVDDYNFIGDCLHFSRDFRGALDFYKRSLEMDPRQYLPRKYSAGLYQYLGDMDEAEKQYKVAVEHAPDKQEAWLDLGTFYLRQSDDDRALGAFEEALKEDSSDVRTILEIASIRMNAGDTTLADSMYIDLAEKNWDNPAMLQSMVPLFFSVNDDQTARRIGARVLELEPGNPDVQRQYAYILFSSQKFVQAESLMIVLDQNGHADSDIYYYLARIRQYNDDYPAAEGYFNKALALNDTLSDAWIGLAMSVDLQGRYQEALVLMKNALDKIPGDSTVIMFYTAVVHSNNERFELARDGYIRLLNSNPDNIQFKFNLGASYERLGQFDDAEREFKQIIKKTPDNPLALNYLGYMYADKGIKLNEALAMIEKAISLDPDNGAFLDSYAWALYKLKRYDEAIVQMNKALEIDDSDAILFDHQGDIYAALNQPDKARESWGKALELDPDNQEIISKLKLR